MQPHELLGVRPGASPREVRAAFRRFAAEHHPDRGGDTARFQAGVDAYHSLCGAPVRPAGADAAPVSPVVFHRRRRGLGLLGGRMSRRAPARRHLR